MEVKNSAIGDGTKISHLTYVGDSDVGRKVNFGCGTVTTNYDGVKKYRCTIEDGAFIGCNTNLVAPVTVGAGSYIAAGATITKDVPADALAVADFKTVPSQASVFFRRGGKGPFSKLVDSLLFHVLTPYPKLHAKACVGCRKCANICPAKAITMQRGKPRIDRKACIHCFCCQEFCPKGAMQVGRNALMRILEK